LDENANCSLNFSIQSLCILIPADSIENPAKMNPSIDCVKLSSYQRICFFKSLFALEKQWKADASHDDTD